MSHIGVWVLIREPTAWRSHSDYLSFFIFLFSILVTRMTARSRINRRRKYRKYWFFWILIVFQVMLSTWRGKFSIEFFLSGAVIAHPEEIKIVKQCRKIDRCKKYRNCPSNVHSSPKIFCHDVILIKLLTFFLKRV